MVEAAHGLWNGRSCFQLDIGSGFGLFWHDVLRGSFSEVLSACRRILKRQ